MAGQDEFARAAEPFRRELLAHCYRMVGSLDDAEELVQETFLRAWRAFDEFDGRSSLRTWLYRIATNVCLSALAHHSRRILPTGLGAPSNEPEKPPRQAGPEVAWLDPIPDALVTADDPADAVVRREGLRLALIASLQYLPGRQRAVLLLRDVLSFRADEVAEMLGTTVAAVKSALQRARARLPQLDDVGEPTGPQARALLDRYITAFERADLAELKRLLRNDAVLEMPPYATWFSGLDTCLHHLTIVVGAPGDWRMVPTSANGQPAAIAYLRGGGRPPSRVRRGVTGNRPAGNRANHRILQPQPARPVRRPVSALGRLGKPARAALRRRASTPCLHDSGAPPNAMRPAWSSVERLRDRVCSHA